MKKTIKYFVFSVFAVMSLSSCDKLETEYGNSLIYFSNTEPKMALLDRINTLSDLVSIADSTVMLTDIYHSGISKKLEGVKVRIEIDEGYMNDLIIQAQQTPEDERTDLMKRYVNSFAMPAEFASVPEILEIRSGQRSVPVPITFNMSKVKLFRNDYLNYTYSDFVGTQVDKDKRLVLCLKITAISKFETSPERTYCFVEVTKCLTRI